MNSDYFITVLTIIHVASKYSFAILKSDDFLTVLTLILVHVAFCINASRIVNPFCL